MNVNPSYSLTNVVVIVALGIFSHTMTDIACHQSGSHLDGTYFQLKRGIIQLWIDLVPALTSRSGVWGALPWSPFRAQHQVLCPERGVVPPDEVDVAGTGGIDPTCQPVNSSPDI